MGQVGKMIILGFLCLVVVFYCYEQYKERRDSRIYWNYINEVDRKQKKNLSSEEQQKILCSECIKPLANAYYQHYWINNEDKYVCYRCNGMVWRSPSADFYEKLKEADRYR